MSAFKKIGIVVTIGAVIAVAYYFLNKSKPTISEEQLADLSEDTVTPVEEQLTTAPTIEEQLQLNKCAGLSRSDYDRCMNNNPVRTGTIPNTSPTGTSVNQNPNTGTNTSVTTTNSPTRSGSSTPTSGSSTPTRVYQSGRRG